MTTHGKNTNAGDEPHYLMVAESLWSDGDLDLSNNFANGDARWFAAESLEAGPHARPNRFGSLWSVHDIGVPVAILPVYVAATRLAAHVPERLARALQTDTGAPRLRPHRPGAHCAERRGDHADDVGPRPSRRPACRRHRRPCMRAVTVGALDVVSDLSGDDRPGDCLRRGLAGLPARRGDDIRADDRRRDRHRRDAVAASEVRAGRARSSCRADLRAARVVSTRGHGPASAGRLRRARAARRVPRMDASSTGAISAVRSCSGALPFSWTNLPRGALGLLFDRSRGLIGGAPIYLLAPAAWLIAWRRTWPWLLPIALLYLPMSAYVDWPSGWAPAARYLAPILPLVALPAAFAVQSRAFRAIAWPILAWQLVLTAVAWQYPRGFWPTDDMSNGLLERVPLVGPVVDRWLPSIATGDPLGPASIWAGLAVAAALIVASRKSTSGVVLRKS